MRRFITLVISFVGFAGAAGAQSLCDNPGESCNRLIEPACLERFGAGAMPAEGDRCAGPMATYRECLATVAAMCGGAAGEAGAPAPGIAKAQGATVAAPTRIEVMQHEAAPLAGCVLAESLPDVGTYLISTDTMFCRPDGAIWLRVSSLDKNYGGRFYFNNVFLNRNGNCNGAQASCVIEDEVSGALRVQVLEHARADNQPVLRVMITKN